jgi:hypothetical protein
MLNTYQAILRDNRLEWTEKIPEQIKNGQPVPVSVTILDESAAPLSVEERGRRMAEILGRLAASNAFRDIADPSEWQREIRKDRPFPDREL